MCAILGSLPWHLGKEQVGSIDIVRLLGAAPAHPFRHDPGGAREQGQLLAEYAA